MSFPVIDSPVPDAVAQFIRRWDASGAAERANYQLFLSKLCDLLGVPPAEPATDDPERNTYVFERDVTFDEWDGTTSTGRIDLYKRACFVLEAKQGSDAEESAEQAESALLSPAERPVGGPVSASGSEFGQRSASLLQVSVTDLKPNVTASL